MKSIIDNVISLSENPRDLLTRVLRDGAQRMLTAAIESEVDDYLKDVNSQEIRVTRNGHAPTRKVQTGLGELDVSRPKLRKKPGTSVAGFESKVLPPYLRKSKSIEELIPWLYLKGISSSDMESALKPLLGQHLKGFSASTVTQLKSKWLEEYDQWQNSALADRIVYLWADGVYFNIRLGEDQKMCILVIIGATAKGEKKLLGIEAGYRESKISWTALLERIRDRGMVTPPKLAIGDGAMGFWAAMDETFPTTKHQRCWVHRTANVLDSITKPKQPEAKRMIHDIYQAESKQEAEKAFKRFEKSFGPKFPKAVAKLVKTKEKTLEFYNFPAEHWSHIRSTNPIESMFATVRLRTRKTKGCGSTKATIAMVFQLSRCAEARWRRLNGPEFMADIIDARFKFVDGVREDVSADRLDVSNTKT
ncbi:MAG: IS256 family transposase [Pseudomonadales bacterium]|nr:IS256 family transposase [Pseudomonadales bacterium]